MNTLIILPFISMHPVLAFNSDAAPFILVIGLAVIATLLFLGSAFLRRWLGLKREQAFLLTIATVLSAIAYGSYRAYQADELYRRGVLHIEARDTVMIAAIFSGLLIFFAVPLALKIYRAWIGAHLSEAEKLPGSAGVRAWLSATNLVFAILVSVCAVFAFNCSFLAILILILLVLLAFPIIQTIMQTPTIPSTPTTSRERESETLSAEREKVLSMLEAGKITAEESAELLNALAATKSPEQPPRRAIKLSRQHRLMLLGAALVLIGFFLPWFSSNPVKEVSRMTGQIQGMMQNFPGFANNSAPSLPELNNSFSSFTFNTPSINIFGGEIPHGFGWLVLLLSVGVAVLPLVADHLDTHTQRTITLLALGAGAIVLLYLLATNVRILSAGILLAAAGYLVEIISALKSEHGIAFIPAMRESAEV